MTKAAAQAEPGATAVISHRVQATRHADYERWLEEIGPACRASPGHLDLHIVRPIPGLTETFTVILRFDTNANLRAWMQSPTRNRLIAEVEPLLVSGDTVAVRTGLDFWFTPEGAKAKVPVPWKQFRVTWSAIFPLVLFVPRLVVPPMLWAGVPEDSLLVPLLVTAAIVFAMVYVIMPRYTKLVHEWLFA